MRVLSPFTLVLVMILSVQALRYNTRVTPQSLGLKLKPFSITNVYSKSFPTSSTSSVNRSINFLFTDVNSNTSSICSHSWTQTNSTNSLSYSWVLCDYTGVDEAFQWHFSSYQSPKQFRVEFMHGWNDYADFEEPYTWVGTFSTENTFNLTCVQGNGIQGCYLPPSNNPHRAAINAISN